MRLHLTTLEAMWTVDGEWGWLARCRCGWESPDVSDEFVAAVHARRHEQLALAARRVEAERWPGLVAGGSGA